MMRVKIAVSSGKYDEIAVELKQKGIEIDENADLILSERGQPADFLIGRNDKDIYRLKISDISHIESFSHDVIAYTDNGSYKISERLKTLTAMLDPSVFIRISKSVIISADHIKSIRPAFTQKFIVTMSDGVKVDVTRSYYYVFKDFLGI